MESNKINNQPLVSVIVPCYKQAKFLQDALESVIDQQYQNWECIIVNDGSPDNTDDVAKIWLKRDSRFKYVKQENKGLSGARNAGIRNSYGEYILPLDADDRIGPTYLQEAVKILESNQKIKVVECEVQAFGESNCILKRPIYSFKHLLLFNGLVSTSLFRKKDYETVGEYDSTMYQEDWDFWIRFLADGGLVHRLPAVHFYYRQRPDSMFHTFSEEIKNKSLEMLYKKHIDLFFREFGAPQQYIAGGLFFDKELESLLKSPRMRLANFLFFPVDVIRNINKKLQAKKE
jgi:glycosyltransferase involved in cell wall biosynthesis